MITGGRGSGAALSRDWGDRKSVRRLSRWCLAGREIAGPGRSATRQPRQHHK